MVGKTCRQITRTQAIRGRQTSMSRVFAQYGAAMLQVQAIEANLVTLVLALDYGQGRRA
jgi:hypothetical protein